MAKWKERTIKLTYAAAALFVFAVWVWGADTVSTSLNGDPRSPLTGLINGTAHTPFVHRALVPIVTRALVGVIPLSCRQWMSESLMASPKFRKEAARLGWDVQEIPEYIVSLALALVSLVALPFVVRSLFVSLYEADVFVTGLVPLGILLGLPPFFLMGTHYIYDFPALFFFTAGFLLLVRKRWYLFYPVYAIGCMNKETMVLLVVAMVLVHGREMPSRKLSLHLLAQLVIAGMIKAALIVTFRNNPGSSVEFHLFGNIHNLLLPYTFENAFFLILLCVLVFHDFRSKHPVLRRAAWLLLPFVLLMFSFAWLGEIRDLYEIYPLFGLLIAHTIAFSLLKRKFTLKV
jgi:hypothetical protein